MHALKAYALRKQTDSLVVSGLRMIL